MKRQDLCTMILWAVLLTAGLTFAGPLEREPGYVDLEWIEIPEDAREIQDIDLSYMLDDLAKDARQDGEDGLAEAIAMVRSIRVKAFSLRANDTRTESAVERINQQLVEDDWKKMIYVKSEDETISVSTKRHAGEMVGLMVVVYEPGENAAFINVVGDLDLGKLLGLAQDFDIDDIDEMVEEHEQRRSY